MDLSVVHSVHSSKNLNFLNMSHNLMAGICNFGI